MAKTNRGKAIRGTKDWRGTCPICKRTGVKLLSDKTVDGENLKVCKICGK
jgi:rRNA maturation endonuclease Nob1